MYLFTCDFTLVFMSMILSSKIYIKTKLFSIFSSFDQVFTPFPPPADSSRSLTSGGYIGIFLSLHPPPPLFSDRAIHFFFVSSLTWWIWNYCIDESVPFWLMWLICGWRTIKGAGMRGAKGADKLVHLKQKSSLSDHPDHQSHLWIVDLYEMELKRKSFFSWLKEYRLCRRKKHYNEKSLASKSFFVVRNYRILTFNESVESRNSTESSRRYPTRLEDTNNVFLYWLDHYGGIKRPNF